MNETQRPASAPGVSPAASSPTVDRPFNGYVVAIGASAGGLEALERFLQHCPTDSGAAFVVVQHLSPDHKSLMHDLLARHTRMPVQVITDGMPLQGDRVFLIPPGVLLRIDQGRLTLTPKDPRTLSLPIDIFFASVAEAFGPKAIGIVLSGTGSDGTRGAAAINAAGGFLLAQDPADARFDGMPASLIASGLVDAVLSADALAQRVVAHMRRAIPDGEGLTPASAPHALATGPSTASQAQEAILQLLLQSGGIDFRDYKPATVMRRIERRMLIHHTPSMNAYLALLEDDRNELSALRRELLIPVTGFFRDPDAFDALRAEVIEPLVTQAAANDPIRVWVAGCSTGEEAYSIAMLFLEAFERMRRWPSLKVFATDVSQQNVDVAAAGCYPESAAAELSPERLERFFQPTGAGYRVKSELRQCIVFARHNLLVDPPFTRMSLVSCRNTLIYFTADAQRRALARLQYAIRPEGHLFLGTSESLAGSGVGFVAVNARLKIFRRTGPAAAPPLSSDEGTRASLAPSTRAHRPAPANWRNRPDAQAPVLDAMHALLEDYVPPTMLINERQEVVHMFGDVSPYFQGRSGVASLELNRLLPERLIPVASALTFKAAKEGGRVMSDWLRWADAGRDSEQLVRLVARGLRARTDETLVLLSFETQSASPTAVQAATSLDMAQESAARVELLERELAATRESLQATIEELETSNEELQATNEELMASNEELQSSNEELQSVNEELNTVNAEFQEKMLILNRVNADLDTMTQAVGVATVFVDEAIRITRFSPDATSVFRLRESDVGRPLEEITHVLKYPGLIEDMRQTLRTTRMLEKEALSPDGRAFLVRILPYSVPSSQTRGVVATFVDITAFHDRQRLQSVLDALPEHVAVLEPEGTIAMVNAAWIRFAKANGDPDLQHCGVGANYLAACPVQPNDEDSRLALQARLGIKSVLEGTAPSFSLQYPCHSPTEQRWFVMNVAPIRGQFYGAVVSHFNVTAWYRDRATDRPAPDPQTA